MSEVTNVSEAVKKAFCGECSGKRNCIIRGEWSRLEDQEVISFRTTWSILQCKGCDNVFIEKIDTNSEDYDQYYGDDGEEVKEYCETITHWPALSKRTKPEWMSEFGIDAEGVDGLDQSMRELYGALDGDLPMLSAIGIRTCFDVAAIILGVDTTLGFARKLERLVELGKIGMLDKDRLSVLIDAGSASVHRGWTPKIEDLNTMVDVLEHFVYEAFVAPARREKLDEKAKELKAKVPARGKAGGVV